MRFSTTVLLGGKTATGLPVPAHVVEALGPRRRVPVVVTVRGHTWRSTIAPHDGGFAVPLSAENRTAAGVAAGDDVEVDVEVDDAPREIDVPDDLAAALDAEPAVRARFDALSPSGKKRHVLSVDGAKTDTTRQRRIAKAVDELRG